MKLEPNINTTFKNKLSKTLSLCGGEGNVVTYPVHFSRPYTAGFQRVFGGAWRLAGEQKNLILYPHGAERRHSSVTYDYSSLQAL